MTYIPTVLLCIAIVAIIIVAIVALKKEDDDDITIELSRQAPTTNAAHSSGFSMKIDDVFHVSGRGAIVTGTISSGAISIHDQITISDANGTQKQTRVKAIEMFHKPHPSAEAGMNVGLVLEDDLNYNQGDIITA